MGEEPHRSAPYVLDGRDEDLERLLDISKLLEPATRDALSTVAIQAGWHVVECGCGPLGALPLLSALVGPTGKAVGLDFVRSTVERGRATTAALGLTNVEVHTADINHLPNSPADVGGPYDMAFTRCFLMHQSNPGNTLQCIGKTLRAGGWLVAMEPLPSPAPFSYPANEDLRLAWELLHQTAQWAGAAPTASYDLPTLAEYAGFHIKRFGGSFQPTDPATGFSLHAATIAAARERIVDAEVANAGEVDQLIERLTNAGADPRYQWVTSPLSIVLTVQMPQDAPIIEPHSPR